MMILIGSILILLAIALVIGNFVVNKEPRVVRGTYRGEEDRMVPPPSWVSYLTIKKGLLVAIVGVLFILGGKSLMYARPGHQYFVVTPFGEKYAIMDSGYKFMMPFSRVQEWEKYIDVKVVPKTDDGDYAESIEGIDGVISDEVIFYAHINGKDVERRYSGIGITFIDKVRGVVSLSSRFQLPQDEPSFIKLAEEFRHPMNLVNNTLIPTVREQVINTAYMFSADDYVSGDASNFRQTLDDQLKNGGFAVDKREVFDTIYSAASLSVSGDIKNKNRDIQEVKSYYEVTKREDKNGKPIRIPHDITKNKILISQVIVDDVDLEPKFRQKLEMQRDISAEKGIELQRIETASAATKRIAAEGERDKTEERMKREKEAVSKLIAEETKIKEQESKRQLEVIALETSKIAYQRRKIDADAKALELQRADGLSEAEKYKIDKMAEVEKAKAAAIRDALSSLTTVIMSGDGDKEKGMSVLESLIGAEMIKSKLPSAK
jgi:hypothetical protein